MIILKYLGGKFYPGIPARDLTRADLNTLEKNYNARLGDAISETSLEQMLVDTGAYQRVRQPRVKAFIPEYENKSEGEE